MGSHSDSVTCYPTQVNAPRLHPSQTGWHSIYRPFKGGGLSKPRPRVQRATGPLLLRDSPEPARPEPMTYGSLVQHADHYTITSPRLLWRDECFFAIQWTALKHVRHICWRSDKNNYYSVYLCAIHHSNQAYWKSWQLRIKATVCIEMLHKFWKFAYWWLGITLWLHTI